MANQRIRLVVLFGGQSAEHDVSCVSARHVLAAADPDKYDVEPIGITREGRWVHATEAAAALAAGAAALPDHLTAAGPDVDPLPVLASSTSPTSGSKSDSTITVAVPILHGPMGEDGSMQGLLELAGVPYVGAGVLGSALCMDKIAAKNHLDQFGLAQARWHSLVLDDADAPDDELQRHVAAAITDLGLPVFVKPANMGSSVGVSKASTHEEVADALRLASSYDRLVLIEEAIRGREIEVAVLGNDDPEASLPGEIVPGAEFYDYADKYEDGAKLRLPAPLTDTEVAEVQQLAITAFKALRVEGLARVDFFSTKTVSAITATGVGSSTS